MIEADVRESDPPDLPSLLRLSDERRMEQAERENDREPDPPHGHLGEDSCREFSRPKLWTAGSSK
jgi:hypothetical protein